MPGSQSPTLATHTTVRGATPRQARTARQAKTEHRGSEWGRGVAARLRLLMNG